MASTTTSDTGTTEKVYSTSEVATMIGIAAVTVRKYSQELESKGYVFLRSEVKSRQKARMYRYKDVETLRYLKEIREKSHITVEQATNITVERLGKGAIQDIASTDTQEIEQYNKQYSELKEMINKQSKEIHKQSELLLSQNELILNLNERLDKQEKYLEQPTENKQIEAPKKEEKPITKQKGLIARIFNM